MLRLALLLLATTPATSLAQAPHVPPGYELAAPVAPTPAPSSPEDAVRRASDANAAGDRRAAATILRDADEAHPRTTSIRLARAALGARLDPALALRLDEDGRRAALSELDSIRGTRIFGFVAGGLSAATGAASLVLLVAGLVGNWECDSVVGVICGPTGSNGGLLTASASLGGGAVALALTSIITLAVAGSRHGAWQTRLASHAALTLELTPEGGYAALSGRF